MIKKEYSANQEGITNMDSFIKSPIPGTVVKVYCQPGQEVKKDQPLISIESMKLEHLIVAQRDVKIKEVRVDEKKFVQMGAKLIIFDE
jgi:biotin carboxyl carrier protein